jgi:hypothetical protein
VLALSLEIVRLAEVKPCLDQADEGAHSSVCSTWRVWKASITSPTFTSW